MTGYRLPPSASVAEDAGDGRLRLPAAERNKDAIATRVAALLDGKTSGQALELASGSGQHIVEHARRSPNVIWQPTEVAPDRLTSIDLYIRDSGLPNLRPARMLDATRPGWSGAFDGQDLILLSNLLHLISTDEVATLIQESARALAPTGQLMFYGPFMRDGQLTSDGDRRFHQDLVTADPRIGYKNDADIADMIRASGLDLSDRIEMPANNLSFIARKPG